MDQKLLDNIIKSNRSVWQPKKYFKISKKGLYEVYFLIFHNKNRSESYWIRYTLLCNKNTKKVVENLNNKISGGGLLWFGYFSSKDSKKNFMVKKHYSLAEVKGTFDKNDETVFITIDKSYLSLQKALGSFSTKSGKAFSWDLELTDFQQPYDIIPKLAKTLKITNTMNKATHPHIKISGKVKFNDEEVIIDNCDAIQYHTYADGYKVPWEWFSIYNIPEWPRGYIDFSYKVDRGILEIFDGKKSFTPWNKNILTKLLASKKLIRKRSDSLVDFSLERDKKIISGTVSVDENDLIGVEYVGPTGEKFYCYNSEIANSNLKIIDRKIYESQAFIIEGNVAFETTTFKPVKGINYLAWEDEELSNST